MTITTFLPTLQQNRKRKKKKEKNCLLGNWKPGITTEQNRTRGGDADTGRGKAFLLFLVPFLKRPGVQYR